jgi:hypothetical protein
MGAMTRRQIGAAAAAAALVAGAGPAALAQAPAVTSYGSRSPSAPAELDLFAFLIGKWQGTSKVRMPDGTLGDGGPVTWIGRWALDGTAIADETHSIAPNGAPGMGMTLRRYDGHAWTVEFINVTGNFIRRQVNPRSGSVKRQGDTVVVEAADGDSFAREYYEVSGRNRFVYRIDLSKDGGKTWDRSLAEFTMTRVE